MLKITDLSKTYKNGKKAVDGLTLHVEPGDIYGFVGPNGAGKTTTIKCACGILDFDAGEILVDGKSIKEQPIACKREMAYIPDNPDLYLNMTGIAYLNFIGDVYAVPAAERAGRIERYAGMLGIYSDLSDIISGFSHGMKQKLAITAALLHEPRLFVLDEPFVGLDPVAAHKLKELLKQICAAGGAVFFSTHVLEVAQTLCNKLAIIKDGRIVTSGTTESIVRDNSLESIFMELVEDENI